MPSGQASGKEVRIGKLVTVKEQVCGGPPAHQRSHLGKPVPDHREPALPPITVALLRANQPFLNPRTCLCSRREEPSKCNRPPPPASPMPESTLVVLPSPPLLADCALRQAAAARCQDLFRERAGGGWVGRGGGGGGVRAHTGASGENQRSHLSTQTLPNSLAHVPAY